MIKEKYAYSVIDIARTLAEAASGSGTAHMVAISKAAGVPVKQVMP